MMYRLLCLLLVASIVQAQDTTSIDSCWYYRNSGNADFPKIDSIKIPCNREFIDSDTADWKFPTSDVSVLMADTMYTCKPDTTWLFKRELPTMRVVDDSLCISCYADDALIGVRKRIDVDTWGEFDPDCYKTVSLPVVTIIDGDMNWVYGQNDGALYQCYRVRRPFYITYDSVSGSIGYEGGGR